MTRRRQGMEEKKGQGRSEDGFLLMTPEFLYLVDVDGIAMQWKGIVPPVQSGFMPPPSTALRVPETTSPFKICTRICHTSCRLQSAKKCGE